MSLLLLAAGLGAGALGALLGIGGGVVLVPLLTLGFGVELPVAAAVSLLCVIATSSGASATYVRDGQADVRLGMKLEFFTVAGAVLGATLAPRLPQQALQLLFAGVCAPVVLSLARPRRVVEQEPSTWQVRNVGFGYAASLGAGALSGTLGIGGGVVKVPIMSMAMGVPFKVATATSSFTIGVTAAASLFVYWRRGLVDWVVAVPAVLGVLAGASLGAKLLPYVPTSALKKIFAAVMTLVGVEMARRGLGI